MEEKQNNNINKEPWIIAAEHIKATSSKHCIFGTQLEARQFAERYFTPEFGKLWLEGSQKSIGGVELYIYPKTENVTLDEYLGH